MLDLALHIIKKKAGRFDPTTFDDRYDAALVELVGERHRLGFGRFASAGASGFREIPRSRIILRHLQEPCHVAHSRGTVVGCRGERRRGLPQRPAQPAAAARAETHLRAVAGFIADVGMHELLVWFAPDSLLEEAGFELSVPPERKAFPRALDRFRRPSVTRRQA
jgi:hypothetical protein